MKKKVSIGNIALSSPFTLAPMAGYGDAAFRRLCRDYGAGLTTTEMVSAKGLLYGNENTERLLRISKNERPSCVQLFGSDPDVLAKVAQFPQVKAFDIIDINMGCPVHKIVKNGDGSALARDPALAAACVEALRCSGRPVTVKMRLGFDLDEFTAPRLAETLERAGAAMLAVHGRYAEQMYRGRADWEKIATVKRAVSIPVFGNGDVKSYDEAAAKLEFVDGVMIGRGALGRPDIFSAEVHGQTLLDIILRHIDYMLEIFPESYAVKNMRKHLGYYLHGVPDTKELKNRLYAMNDIETVKSALREGLRMKD